MAGRADVMSQRNDELPRRNSGEMDGGNRGVGGYTFIVGFKFLEELIIIK